MRLIMTRQDIQKTVDHDNLVVRNLQVTQGYYRLSQGMRKLMGSKNVSWCAFATHASKTAGQALRHELMPSSLKSAMIRMAGYDNTYFFLDSALGKPAPELTSEHNSLLGEAMKKVSLLISAGNILVYDELAWPFASLVNAFARDWQHDENKINAFLSERFVPGPLEEGGQDYLIEAFRAFYDARFETNSKRKAEYILQANLLIGLHEQTRLQPHIEEALSVPFDIFKDGRSMEKADDVIKAGSDMSQKGGGMYRKLATRAVTQMLMGITLPSRELKLGKNVVAPTGVVNFPQDLLTIEYPRCKSLVRQFETGSDTLSGSAAENWASLKDRMSFVVDFFRSHQQYKRLFEQPFIDNQVPAIDAGHLPAGPL
jgi:hypothetical protein